MHADWALLPRGHFPKRADIPLRAEIQLASSFLKFLLDARAVFLMLLAVLVLTFLITIPNTLAPVALLEGITFISARRTQLGRGGPIFLGGGGFIILSFHRFTERHGAKLLSSCCCIVLFR